ncbi:hypothetical protein GCM10010387_43670 [Streptomyces inusitatus]|uniref:PPM-type phosphatase domain-containing protein n=1 Tax=Streptomyces inusitatus TaxID=68221 RepID=A0A918QGQ9_9ACTN|nr:hypothetical protein [Streptomyces inusitatus]GGZ44659.1 hypothetical protein GCM10010387_43670 [Streptomyces inusitatus]
MTHTPTRLIAATATRRGTRTYNCDAGEIYRLPGTGIVAAAIVDGIGNNPSVARFSRNAAYAIARTAARRTPLLGILAAAGMATAPPGARAGEDGVAAVAVAHPGRSTVIAWTGDSRVYSLPTDGDRLIQRSTDQTMGEWMRNWGDNQFSIDLVTFRPEDGPARTMPMAEAAVLLDDVPRSTLAHCSMDTVLMLMVSDPLVVITSDGVHTQLPHGELERLAREYADRPQKLADAIVAAVLADPVTGYRDDATAIVIANPREQN